jgi:hypothetical protein
MLRSHFLFFSALLTSVAAFVPQHAFLRTSSSSLQQRGSVRQQSSPLLMNISPTQQHDDWDLPDKKPGSSSSSSPPPSSSADTERRRRQLLEQEQRQKFITGDDLHTLREQAMNLRQELQNARASQDLRRVQALEKAILKVQQVDPEFMYVVALERMDAAKQNGNLEEAQLYEQQAMEARAALPQFQMSGLWVGKYGESCYEMINVTYVGDTMVAYKVTGHSNVPRGEISFQVDLSPRSMTNGGTLLEPIELEDVAAEQWGAKYLPRFAGQGQVASEGFVNSQYVEGQLILVNEYFSFAWVPIGHQVFFGRPSPDLTLQMLKDADAPNSPEEKMRAHLERCLEETEILEEEECDGGFYSQNQHDYYNQEGCFE